MGIDARDVLDVNAVTRDALRARITGRFERTGPNRWDDFRLVLEDGEAVDVFASVKIQLEDFGTEFRMRWKGQVVLLDWVPTAEDLDSLDRDTPKNRRGLLLEHYVGSFDEAPGIGAAAVIASKLMDD